jgi:hypothetical protein
VLAGGHVEQLLRPKDVVTMDDTAGRHPNDRDRHAKRVVRSRKVGDLAKPADERLRVA